MPISKEQKKQVVKKLKENLEKQKSLFFIDIQKLKAKEIFELRRKLKEAGGSLYVAKKNLAKIAFEEKKLPVEIKDLKGQLGLVFGIEKEINPVKAIYEFWQEHKTPELIGGLFENEFISGEKAVELAQLPSKEELLARVVASLSSPLSGFLNVLEGNIRNLIYILKQIKTENA